MLYIYIIIYIYIYIYIFVLTSQKLDDFVTCGSLKVFRRPEGWLSKYRRVQGDAFKVAQLSVATCGATLG